MRRMAIVALMGLSACGKMGSSWGRSPETDTLPDPDPIPDPDPSTLTCDFCVDVPPATFTGPSNIWMGPLGATADCPAATPILGLEGYLLDPSRLRQFARECRITPSDTCGVEGQVCAPVPDADFHTCIHHSDEAACPRDYPERYLVTASEDDRLVTLCCQPARVPA